MSSTLEVVLQSFENALVPMVHIVAWASWGKGTAKKNQSSIYASRCLKMLQNSE